MVQRYKSLKTSYLRCKTCGTFCTIFFSEMVQRYKTGTKSATTSFHPPFVSLSSFCKPLRNVLNAPYSHFNVSCDNLTIITVKAEYEAFNVFL